MKPPVALFKKKSKKLCLYLKAKSQNLIKQFYVVYVVCFISYLSFKNNTSLN